MSTKTTNESEHQTEPNYFVGSDFDDGQKLVWKSLAKTEQEFRDTETGELMTAPLFIMKVNDGETDGYLKIWGNTDFKKSSVCFKQLQTYLDDNNITVLPLLNINKELTVETGGKGTRTYYFFKELVRKIDLSKLGI